MDAVAVFGILKRDRGGNSRATVAALGIISSISQPQHQFTLRPRDLLRCPTAPFGFAGKTVSRQRWTNHVESVFRFPTMRGGIGKRRNNFQEFNDRPRT